MTTTAKKPAAAQSLAYNGYHRQDNAEPNMVLCGVGRDTPGGEWHRRFWQPVAYEYELTDVPLRVRALGEDLVCFRDKSGRVGVLHLHCGHRNTSLEYGVIEQEGIRCCYHGRLYAVDGQCVQIPGDPAEEKLRKRASQGGYPVHLFAGIVFAYMGPPETMPVFPVGDRFDIPGLRLVPGIRSNFACNWLQVKENAVDPHHTHFLHVIPQMRGMEHFANEFGNYPEMTWSETPGGIAYFAARRVGDNVWVRSSEVQGASVHIINSIFESGRERKAASRPFLSFWSLPVDDTHTVNFFISHVSDDEVMPFEERRRLEVFRQNADRPYRERQWIPGDNEAMASQGPVNVHAMEQLGSLDRGVAMYRRYVRNGIEAVQRGETPLGVYRVQSDVPPTYANDLVIGIDQFPGNPDDGPALLRFAESLPERYTAAPPMLALKNEASK
jgi:phenylpropionate dioxygenase-like ring-hydroxylating dioxygenase large terminal subunit